MARRRTHASAAVLLLELALFLEELLHEGWHCGSFWAIAGVGVAAVPVAARVRAVHCGGWGWFGIWHILSGGGSKE